MPISTPPWDPTEVLKTAEAIDEYLVAAQEEGDAEFIADAQRVAAAARERWNIPE